MTRSLTSPEAAACSSARTWSAWSTTAIGSAQSSEFDESCEFPRADERAGDEQIADPGRPEDFGLAEFRACHADRARIDHHSSQSGTLVALRVRTPGDSLLAKETTQPGDVSLQRIQVDDERGGVEFEAGTAHRD